MSIFLLFFAPLASGALRYLPGNDARPLIRRDLLPLDTDAIRDLAGHLALIADGPFPQSASQLRHRAQILTLSQRLLPAQARARAIESSLQNGASRPRPDNEKIRPAREKLLASADWLTRLPPDSEGHHLGQLLLDVLHPVAPEAEVFQRHDAPEAPKRWEGVVAEVARFENRKIPPPDLPKPGDPETKNPAKYAITALLTEVPMFSEGLEEGATASPGLVTTSLVITEASPSEPAEGGAPNDQPPGGLRFQPETEFKVDPLYQALLAFFKTNLEPLPEGYNLNINTNKQRYLAKNRKNIAANVAMLLDAAVSGKPLRRNTLLFARLRADGSLQKPLLAWELMIRLEELQVPIGTRIIVGPGMLDEMTGMLVLDKASFFTKYEVLEAPTFQAARVLFYEEGKLPAELQAASDGYREVRDKAVQATNLGTFLSLASVEERLVKAANFSPRHLSAKMLATQAIRRPAYFSRSMFARELNRLLDPLSQFEFQSEENPERAAKNAYKETRDRLNLLRRRLQRAEIATLEDALGVIKDLNSIGRGASAAQENEERIRQQDLDAFQKKLEAFRAKLRTFDEPDTGKDE